MSDLFSSGSGDGPDGTDPDGTGAGRSDPDGTGANAFDPARFATAFQDFLESMMHLSAEARQRQVVTVFDRHLGTSARSLDPVRQEFAVWRWADIDAALEALSPDQDLYGVVPSGERAGLSDVLVNRYGIHQLGAVERQAVPSGPGRVRHVATNAVRLLRVGSSPVAVFAHVDTSGPEPRVDVEVLAGDERLARSVLAEVDAHVRENSVLRGQVVGFVEDESGSGSVGIGFHPRPQLGRDDIVLPAGTLERVEAAVVGVSRNAPELRAAGQHLSRGVLLYGPPGTGKTHTVRYLLSRSPDTTAFMLHGDALGRIRQAAAAARSLGRAIIVLEDADLVAADRGFGEGERSVLFEVLDILDGLDDDTDVAFVLTTNRVDVLEEALALRPGRVDLAVEVPLPTRTLREQLFARYARKLPVTREGLELAALRSEGTTGSFAKEAVRRAVLGALSATDEADDRFLLTAVEALVEESGELREAMGRDAADGGFDAGESGGGSGEAGGTGEADTEDSVRIGDADGPGPVGDARPRSGDDAATVVGETSASRLLASENPAWARSSAETYGVRGGGTRPVGNSAEGTGTSAADDRVFEAPEDLGDLEGFDDGLSGEDLLDMDDEDD